MSVDFCSAGSQEYFSYLTYMHFSYFQKEKYQLHQVPIIQNSCYAIPISFIVLEFQLTYAALTLIPVVHFLYVVGVLSKNFRYANWIYLVQEITEDSERNGFKYCIYTLMFNTQKRQNYRFAKKSN